MIKKTINSDIPYVPWLTGYIAILMGAILTFIVQSSSVFTTTLTPLVGVGLITVDRVYPLTLGSNLGTTTTAMIAALAAEGSERLRNSLQVKYTPETVYFLSVFNIFLISTFWKSLIILP